MHFLGGVAIGYFFAGASRNASAVGLIGPYHPVTHVVLVFALVATAAMSWEFAEFLCDRAFGTHAQVDLEDTMLDMLLGLFGGVASLVAGRMAGPDAEDGGR